MLGCEEALRTVLDSVVPLGETESVSLLDAACRVLGQDMHAGIDLPGFDNSAMDGYALTAADTADATADSPVALRVVAEIPAGSSPPRALGPGEAARIMTGAPVPEGADSVVMVEETATSEGESGELVEIPRAIEAGAHVRRAGEDVKRGDLVMSQGRLVRPVDVAMLAALGCDTVGVFRRPGVAVLSTGSELVGIADAPAPGQVHDSNSAALCAGIAACGGLPFNLGFVTDNEEELARKVAEGLGRDMFLVTGGVSVGKYDMVKRALEASGVDIKFWKVAIKPGKPVVFGAFKGRPVFGLPGNPVSALVAFEVLVKPALWKLSGRTGATDTEVSAVIEDDFRKKPGRRHFVRVWVSVREGRYHATLTGPQGSGVLSSMVRANGLAVIPEETVALKRGDTVRIRLLDDPGGSGGQP